MLRASLSRLASRARFPQQQQLRQCQTSAASTTAASAAPTKRTVSFGSRLMAQYEAALEAQPLITKSVTSGVLYGVGDWVAQTVEQRRASSSENEQPKPFDSARWARAMVFGGIFYPGVAHLHYNFLENLVVARWAVAPSRVPFVKMFIEQFVYWSYFSNAYYHAVLGALQGMTVEQVTHRVSSTLWDTLKAQWAFWIPAQLVNFKYVPVRHQLNFVLVVSLFWTTFLSLAFPPEALADDSAEKRDAPSKE